MITNSTKHANLQLSYWVDSSNIIRKVDDHWDKAMNSESWSERASAGVIIGKPLSNFICDDVTRMYVATMIESVRVIPHTSFRPYRCDTPDTKRFMQMIITPEENGWIRVSHELLRTEPMKKPVAFKTVVDLAQSKHMVLADGDISTIQYVRCSLCNRLHRIGDLTRIWQEADLFADHETILTPIKVIYGVCPDCLKFPRYNPSTKIIA
ncbi:MAG: hypothetical protein DYH15_09175 [Nitrosomonas sp. PRO4]|nr:hypothetical protein [Nitrosomonas sp. PRO4]